MGGVFKRRQGNGLNVMKLLQEQGAVDEISIGVIRDAFANLFFSGTSTVVKLVLNADYLSFAEQQELTSLLIESRQLLFGHYGTLIRLHVREWFASHLDAHSMIVCLFTGPVQNESG